jgi:hypothetical protein
MTTDLITTSTTTENNPMSVCNNEGMTDASTPSLIFDNLDLLQHIISFIGLHHYRFVAGIHPNFRIAYQKLYGSKYTYIKASIIEHAKICFHELNEKNMTGYLIICKTPNMDEDSDDDDYDNGDDEEKSDVKRLLESLICRDAARQGKLDVLQYLKLVLRCSWDAQTCTEAAGHNHLHILQWARQHHCPWNSDAFNMMKDLSNKEVLLWLANNGCKWHNWHTDMKYIPALRKRMDVLQWAYVHGCSCYLEEIFNIANECGDLEMVAWCSEMVVLLTISAFAFIEFR